MNNNKIKSLMEKIENNFFSQKSYFYSLLPYILISGIIFSLGIIIGYCLIEIFPSESEKLISLFKQTYEPILKMPKFSQILFIFLKNGITSFSIIITGIFFGIIPIVSLISNGEVLGILFGFNLSKYNLFYLLLGILPHGIIEIPCFLITSAIGLKIGRNFIKKIFGKEGNLKEELNSGLIFFLKIIILFLFLAAVLEVLVSPELLRIY